MVMPRALLFGRLVDFVVTHRLRMPSLGQRHGDGGGQGRLAVVNVADRADVYMRLIALKLLLSHSVIPPQLFGHFTAGR